MTLLLTSVRNLAEAKIAVKEGTDWLDLKEPDAGALGAVPGDEISRVISWSKKRHCAIPTSATIGDCWWQPEVIPERVARLKPSAVDYIKIGLYVDRLDVRTHRVLQSVCAENKIIIVCLAEKPFSAAVIQQLIDTGVSGLMLDTAEKTSGNLLAKLSNEAIGRFVSMVKEHNVLCGLAGSLKSQDVAQLMPLGADYLGFRGAICANSRSGSLSAQLVRGIKSELQAYECSVAAYATN